MEMILKNVRLAFAQALWEPEDYDNDGKFKYKCTVLMPPNHPQMESLRAVREKVLAAKFGAKLAQVKEELTWKQDFIRNGNLKPDYDGFPGNTSVHFSRSKKDGPPMVVDANPKVQLTQADGRPYSGCYVNVKFDVYAYGKSAKGVSAGLLTVQFLKDGDAFSTKPPSDEGLEDVSEGSGAADLV